MEALSSAIPDEIAFFMRRLYRQGLTTTSGGNISVRDGDTIWITPGGTDKGRMRTGEIGRMRLADGQVLSKGFQPTCEADLHLTLYRRRPDIQAVVHAHPVTASAFAAAACPISNRLLGEAYVVLGEIIRVGYQKFGTLELASAVAAAAATGDTLLLDNHGAIALGQTLLQAFDRLEVLENAARTTLICDYLLRGQATPLGPEQLGALRR